MLLAILGSSATVKPTPRISTAWTQIDMNIVNPKRSCVGPSESALSAAMFIFNSGFSEFLGDTGHQVTTDVEAKGIVELACTGGARHVDLCQEITNHVEADKNQALGF